MILLLFGMIYYLGCGWPRDNPLDPKAINYGITDPPSGEFPELSVTSFHSSQWFPNEDYFALEIVVSGVYTDLADSVIFVYDDSTNYQLNRESDIWRVSLESSIFPGNSLADLIGLPFCSVLYLDSDSIAVTEERYLFRVIDEVPSASQPMNELVSATPDFFWEAYEAKFTFTYTISIVHLSLSGYGTEVKSVTGIVSDSTNYTLTDSLPSGDYYWTIAVSDIFGNTARSKEAGFSVIE